MTGVVCNAFMIFLNICKNGHLTILRTLDGYFSTIPSGSRPIGSILVVGPIGQSWCRSHPSTWWSVPSVNPVDRSYWLTPNASQPCATVRLHVMDLVPFSLDMKSPLVLRRLTFPSAMGIQ